jgi:uncharacterized membrane protein
MTLLTWRRRHDLKVALHSSLWPVPVAAMLAAVAVAPALLRLDEATRWTLLGFGADGARGLVAALVASMLTFIVFVFSILLVVLQVASGTLTPRIIATVFRYPPMRRCVGLFVFAFTYGTAALGRIEERTPQLPVLVTILLSLASIAAFLYLVDRLGHELRPVAVMSDIGRRGTEVIDAVYPLPWDQKAEAEVAALPAPGPVRVVTLAARSGVVLAFDSAGLARIAGERDGVIEMAPQVGDFVATGSVLFRLHGGAAGIDDRLLRHSLALGAERTFEQDPLFPFRVIVDVAAKALSPAINDPTTGVLALDQIHHLLARIARHRLDTGVVRDAGGRVRLVYRTPDWPDFVKLGCTEIRLYGIGSPQVMRRLRALLEDLLEALPEARHAALRGELTLLDRAVERGFPEPEDRALATGRDLQGLGSGQHASR